MVISAIHALLTVPGIGAMKTEDSLLVIANVPEQHASFQISN